MATKRNIEVVEEIDVPAEFLWQTISDFEHIDHWTNLKVRLIEGNGIGCKRTVEMETGALVTEQLLACDNARMVFRYEILAPNPYPMHNYQSEVTIEKISAQRSRLRWVGEYTPPKDIDPARTDNLLRKVYSNGIRLLREHFVAVSTPAADRQI